MQRPWKQCTELQSNAQSPWSGVQSSWSNAQSPWSSVWSRQCTVQSPRAMQSPWSSVWSPWSNAEPLEQCIEPQNKAHSPRAMCGAQAPAGSSIWVNPCLAPGRQLENRSGSCLRNLCSLLELHRGTKAALCAAGSQSPSPRSSAVPWGLWLLPPPSLGKAFSDGDGGMCDTDSGPRCSLPTHNLLIQLVPLQCSSFWYF